MLRSLSLFLSLFFFFALNAQQYIIDRVVAVVGDETILQSDVEGQYIQMKAQGYPVGPNSKCQIFESLLESKLLISQAKLDSLEVNESSVQIELNQRMDYFSSMVGGERELEQYFGKTIPEIKEDFRDMVYEKQLAERMREEITSSIKITPSEVKQYFNKLNKDSVPEVPESVELQQIVIYPEIPEQAIFEVREKLLGLRKRILNGESFVTLAVLYSEDGSASRGGEIGFMGRGELDKEYAKVAFGLKENGISGIVESEFGFHLIQLIERKGERVNTRHILIKPKIPVDALIKAQAKLDSIAGLIRNDSISFDRAAYMFNQDKNTILNGGLRFNSQSGSSLLFQEELTPEERDMVARLQVNSVSEPFETKDEKGKTAYKIMKLKKRIPPHKANMEQDYTILQNMALNQKREKAITDWIQEKQASTYITLGDAYSNCTFFSPGWKKKK